MTKKYLYKCEICGDKLIDTGEKVSGKPVLKHSNKKLALKCHKIKKHKFKKDRSKKFWKHHFNIHHR